MGTFKKTDYTPICKVFPEVFFYRQNSTFHSSHSFSSKGQGNLVTAVVGSLTACINVATINWGSVGPIDIQMAGKYSATHLENLEV